MIGLRERERERVELQSAHLVDERKQNVWTDAKSFLELISLITFDDDDNEPQATTTVKFSFEIF